MSQLTALLLQDGGGFAIGFAFIIVMILIAIGGFCLWLGLAYWTYKDAKKRNIDSPELWGLVVFAAGVFGLIVYILVRDDR